MSRKKDKKGIKNLLILRALSVKKHCIYWSMMLSHFFLMLALKKLRWYQKISQYSQTLWTGCFWCSLALLLTACATWNCKQGDFRNSFFSFSCPWDTSHFNVASPDCFFLGIHRFTVCSSFSQKRGKKSERWPASILTFSCKSLYRFHHFEVGKAMEADKDAN